MSSVLPNITHQRCANHREREAAARCIECSRYFCRECVTEHEERLLCAGCLRAQARPALFDRPVFAGLVRAGQALLGLVIAWFFFYLLAEALLAMPSSFHEGTLWQ